MKFIYDKSLVKIITVCKDDYLGKWYRKHKTFFEEPFLKYLKDAEILNQESCVLDIGACFGNHTIYFSKFIKVKKVIALEPTLESFEILQKNIELNGLKNVVCRRLAILSENGIAKCYRRKPNNIGTNIWSLINEMDIDDENAYALTLDSIYENIDFIKIDAESSELEILKGGRNLINRCKPTILIEVSKTNLSEFEEIIDDLNYELFALDLFKKCPSKKANTLLMRSK